MSTYKIIEVIFREEIVFLVVYKINSRHLKANPQAIITTYTGHKNNINTNNKHIQYIFRYL